MKQGGLIWFILYVVFAAYFINFAFNFVTIPEAIIKFEKWIILVGGVLILLGAINHFRVKRNTF